MSREKKLLIEGETSGGKDTLAKLLQQEGLKPVCSYATRPMRPNETQGVEHKFITPEEAKELLSKRNDDLLAYTKIGEFEYFAFVEDLLEADMYIIDPKGIEFLYNKFPELREKTTIVYVTSNINNRIERASKRGDGKNALLKRMKAESKQFANLSNYDIRFDNDGPLLALEEFSKTLL